MECELEQDDHDIHRKAKIKIKRLRQVMMLINKAHLPIRMRDKLIQRNNKRRRMKTQPGKIFRRSYFDNIDHLSCRSRAVANRAEGEMVSGTFVPVSID